MIPTIYNFTNYPSFTLQDVESLFPCILGHEAVCKQCVFDINNDIFCLILFDAKRG